MTLSYIQKRLEGTWKQAAEAIVLAGGLGTRLREAVPDTPKCMAPVANRPFLYYVIQYLRKKGIQKIIFSLGYKHEVVEDYLQKEFSHLQYEICVETEPLGTGGALQLAMGKVSKEDVLVVNGDSFFAFNFSEMQSLHTGSNAACTLALKPMQQFDRYGAVTLDAQNRVIRFEEKKYYESGLINAGVYLINKKQFLEKKFPEKFSFEKEYLEPSVANGTLYGSVSGGYFIDIGIPLDYNQAQKDFTIPPLNLAAITRDWTLFLDRDGVINEDKPNSYVMHAGEFEFYKDAPEALVTFSTFFKKIIIITNQRGIGRGLMDEPALEGIHKTLTEAVSEKGGHIDAIYYATANDGKDFFRKPNPGMALQAAQDFPDINFSKSIMVGNNISDMRFGRNAGMYNIYLSTTNEPEALPHPDIDLQFANLKNMAAAIPGL